MKRSSSGEPLQQDASLRRLAPEELKRARLACEDLLTRVATPQSLFMREFEAHVKSCQMKQFTFDYYMHGVVEESGEVFEAVRALRDAGAELQESRRAAIA